MSHSDTDEPNPANVIVLVCGPDGLCSLCAGEDRTGTDGCGSYFQAGDIDRLLIWTLKKTT